LSATPGVGSAALSWIAPPSAGSGITGWLVAAVDQEPGAQTSLQWHRVAAGSGCTTMTTRIGGLTSGHRYGFLLEESVTSPEDGLPLDRTVGRADPVVVR
jgi:hypothetical protein